jgi:hypothetical protein
MSLFLLHCPEVTIYLLIYVDDIIVISSSPPAVDRLILGLRQAFAVKDLGLLHYFFGVDVTSLSHGLSLTQCKYATDLLGRAGMHKCAPATTPMSASVKFFLS